MAKKSGTAGIIRRLKAENKELKSRASMGFDLIVKLMFEKFHNQQELTKIRENSETWEKMFRNVHSDKQSLLAVTQIMARISRPGRTTSLESIKREFLEVAAYLGYGPNEYARLLKTAEPVFKDVFEEIFKDGWDKVSS